MAGSGTLTFNGTLVGFPTGQRTFNIVYAIAAAVDDSISLGLSSGDNSIAVPGNANAVIIELPAGNTTLVKLKGQFADAGVALHKTFPLIWPLDVSQVSFVLNAAAPISNVQLTFF